LFETLMETTPRNLLSDCQWKTIEPATIGRAGQPGRTATNTRRFVDGVLWVMRTGAPWRDLPPYFGKWSTSYQRFLRWARSGRWRNILQFLQKEPRENLPENTIGYLDSTSIRVHQHGAPRVQERAASGVGISRGGKTTKLHAVATSDDKPFLPLSAGVSPGQTADVCCADRLVRALPACVQAIVADKAYDSDTLRATWAATGRNAVVPGRRNRLCPQKVARRVYGQRNVIERLFARIKQYRRIASRFERKMACWQAFCCLALARVALGFVAEPA
jgi:transposase